MSRIIRATAGVIAAQAAAGGPTPLLDFKFAGNLTNDGSYGGSVSSNGTPTYTSGGAEFGSGNFTNVYVAGSSTVLTNMAAFTFQCDYTSLASNACVLAAVYGAWSFELNTDSGGTLKIYLGTDNNSFGIVAAVGSGLHNGSLHNIKITYITGELKTTIDSTLLDTTTTRTGDVLANSGDLYIGSNYIGTQGCDGIIDNLLFYDSVV